MLTIRSTEKLAKSEHNGLCDISRKLKTFTIEKNSFTVGIEDKLFQEKVFEYMTYDYVLNEETNEVEQVENGLEQVTERIIIEDKGIVFKTYPLSLLDEVFEAVGTDIVKGANGFKEQFLVNALTIVIAQTQTADDVDNTGWHGMLNWVEDTPHKIVYELSVSEENTTA